MDQWALIYYYWNDCADKEVWRDMQNPIIPAIATFRANNVTAPIFVIDSSNKRNDWSCFPFRLKFEVLRREPYLGHSPTNNLNGTQMKLFSRAFDVPALASEIDADCYVFSDGDIFWMKDMLPYPEPIDGIYCNPVNNGLYYWNRGSESASRFFGLWQQEIMDGVSDFRRRTEILSCYYAGVFNDEAAYCSVRARNPGLVKDIGWYDNCADPSPDQHVVENTKNIHFCGSLFGVRRGMYGLMIREFYEKIRIHLTEAEVVRIYGDKAMHLAGAFTLSQLHKARLKLNDRRKLFL